MEKLLSITEASELTGLTVSTLYVFISQRKIPYVKLGKRVFFIPSELERWIIEHSRKEIKAVR